MVEEAYTRKENIHGSVLNKFLASKNIMKQGEKLVGLNVCNPKKYGVSGMIELKIIGVKEKEVKKCDNKPLLTWFNKEINSLEKKYKKDNKIITLSTQKQVEKNKNKLLKTIKRFKSHPLQYSGRDKIYCNNCGNQCFHYHNVKIKNNRVSKEKICHDCWIRLCFGGEELKG